MTNVRLIARPRDGRNVALCGLELLPAYHQRQRPDSMKPCQQITQLERDRVAPGRQEIVSGHYQTLILHEFIGISEQQRTD